LNQKSTIELISREEIRAVYVRGEEAVIELIEGLVEKIGKLEERVDFLEGKDKKNSSNSSKPPSGDGFGKKTKRKRNQEPTENRWTDRPPWLNTGMESRSRCGHRTQGRSVSWVWYIPNPRTSEDSMGTPNT
jgi:hypothetical protein